MESWHIYSVVVEDAAPVDETCMFKVNCGNINNLHKV